MSDESDEIAELRRKIECHERTLFHRHVFAAVFAARVVQSVTETRDQVARWSWTTATIAVDEYERLAKERTP